MATLTTVLLTYNASRFLRDCLDSLAAQTRRPDRIVIIDDASQDDSADIAESYSGLDCEVVRSPTNIGLFPSHNRALEYAEETDYLHILHGDDVIYPRCYELMLTALEGRSESRMAYCKCRQIDARGEVIEGGGKRLVSEQTGARLISPERFITAQAHIHPLGLNAVLLHTARRPALLRFREDFPQVGDCIFHAEWAARCDRILLVPQVLAAFRIHGHNQTHRNMREIGITMDNEWQAMRLMNQLVEGTGWRAKWRRLRLKLRFAVRSRWKLRLAPQDQPAMGEEISRRAPRLVGAFAWQASWWLVYLRSIALRLRLVEND